MKTAPELIKEAWQEQQFCEGLLREFYLDYKDWLDEGAVEGGLYSRGMGLCSALQKWKVYAHASMPHVPLEETQRHMWRRAGLHERYPFSSGENAYFFETDRNKAHLNTKRIAWVTENCEDRYDAYEVVPRVGIRKVRVTARDLAASKYCRTLAEARSSFREQKPRVSIKDVRRTAFDKKMEAAIKTAIYRPRGAGGEHHEN